ncbi:carboxypeptidase-like regulatory domain-containing protein [Halorhodospira halochloris]|uniref:carboxypeptidase-like regulatory domain-containing protein n=1 Tax=Halorhodospira halochloris TaxID=1052 RepID=UPI0013A53DB2|nr:carboxypeptidase-like regulatory domain-containing protein [Halorhodospira halochloris]
MLWLRGGRLDWRPGWAAWLLAIGLILWSPSVPAPLSVERLQEEDEAAGAEDMVLRLELEGYTLSESEYMLQKEDDIYYPLGQLARHLELALDVDPLEGEVSGWILEQDREVSFDTASGMGEIDEDPLILDEADWIQEHDDLYFREAAIQEFLPVDFDYRPRSAEVHIRAREDMPVLRRLEREARWAQLRDDAPGEEGEEWLPREELPPRALTRPAWSLSLDQRLNEERSSTSADLAGAGDLLWHDSEWRLLANDDDYIRRFDGTLGQQVGHPALERYELGRVNPPRYDLLRRGSSGMGVTVTNRPEGVARTTFTDQSIEIEVPQGWDVELYRDDDLVDFAQDVETDRHEFDDIDARSGTNHYTIELYGPHGERETITRTIEIGPGLLPPGTVHYSLDATREGKSIYEDDPQDDYDQSAAGRVDVGVTESLSVGADIHYLDPEEDDYSAHGEVAGADAAFSAFGVWGRLRGAWESGNGRAWQLALDRGLGPIDLSYEYTHVAGLATDEIRERVSGDLRHKHELHLAGSVGGLRTRLRYEHQESAGGDSIWQRLRTRENIRLNGLMLRHSLTVSREDYEDIIASGNVRTRWGRHREGRINLGLNYDLAPDAELNNANAEYSQNLNEDWRGSARLRGSFNDRPHSLRLGLSRITREYWRFSGRGEVDSEGSWQVSVGLDVGGLPHPDGGWVPDPEAGRGYDRGAVMANIHQDGEPVEGVEVCAERACGATDADGEAWVARLEPHEPVNVEVDVGSIDNPFVQPASRGVSFVPRPGRVLPVDFELHVTGEIDGVVERRRGVEAPVEASGFELEALDTETGELISTARSAYDGLYILDQLPPGDYLVQASEGQAERLGAPQEATAQQVTVEGDGDLVSNMDMTIHDGGEIIQLASPAHPVEQISFDYDAEHELREHLAHVIERLGAEQVEGGLEALVEEVRMLNGELADGTRVVVPTDRAPLDEVAHWEHQRELQIEGE